MADQPTPKEQLKVQLDGDTVTLVVICANAEAASALFHRVCVMASDGEVILRLDSRWPKKQRRASDG